MLEVVDSALVRKFYCFKMLAFELCLVILYVGSGLGEKLPEFPFPGVYGKDYIFHPSETDPMAVVPVYFNDDFGYFAKQFQSSMAPKMKTVSLVTSTYDDEGVQFYLYTSKTRDKEYELIPGNLANLQKSPFEKGQPVKILCHGWLSSYDKKEFPQDVKNKYLEQDNPLNVIAVNWNDLIGRVNNYIPARKHVRTCGTKLGQLIQFLVDQKYVSYDDIHFIGHSLGAHVGQAVAQQIGSEKLGRITGLDPAAPGFIGYDGKLNEKCAKFVDVIHTETTKLGLMDPLGKVDFYPNGGYEQPGCPKVSFWEFWKFDSCSHARSHEYFHASVDVELSACKCRDKDTNAPYYEPYADFEKFKNGQCNCTDRVLMGEGLLGKVDGDWKNGIYFLETDNKFPFTLDPKPKDTNPIHNEL